MIGLTHLAAWLALATGYVQAGNRVETGGRYQSASASITVAATQNTPVAGTSVKECALSCIKHTEVCQGFVHDPINNVCHFHRKVCVAENGLIDIFVRTFVATAKIDTRLARYKASSMSSLRGTHFASKGNDGLIPLIDVGMFHTNEEANPYWRVDLEELYCISAVFFVNRGYSTSSDVIVRARNIVVTVSQLEADVGDTGDNRCGYISGVVETLDNLVTCPHQMLGQFVQLQMLDTGFLHFYEVEVHGY